jgi:cytochrome c oxidase cbb3-type subunit 3
VNTQQKQLDKSEEAVLLDHECDGIREYDNPMPAWWTGIFWVSILFALPYFAFYHLGGVGTTLADNYETEVGAFYEMQAAKLGNLKPDAPTILTLATDGQKMLAGRNMFRANCATCHGRRWRWVDWPKSHRRSLHQHPPTGRHLPRGSRRPPIEGNA